MPPSEEPTHSTSLIGRLSNVFAAPSEVFEEVKTSPPSAANWLVPALLIILVGWVGSWLVFSQPVIKQQLSDITSKAIEKQIEKGKIPKEQAEAARQAGEKWGSIGTKISMVAAPLFGAFVTPFWSGLILWGIGRLVLKGNFRYMKAVEVAGLANMIGVLDGIVKTLLIIAMGNLFVSPGPALLVKEFDPQNSGHAILGALSVMSFWQLGVRSVGLARLSGASFGKAAVWVFGLWLVFVGIMIGFAAAVRAAFGG